MSTAQQQKIITLKEKKANSINSYEKAMYGRMIEEEEGDICSGCHREYDMIDWKKEMESDKQKYI